MTVKSLAHDDQKTIPKGFRKKTARCDGFEALDNLDIADLSAAVINGMTCDELVRMIRVANLPALLSLDLDQHLPFYDRTVLTRLAHLAQRCCCNQRQALRGKDVE